MTLHQLFFERMLLGNEVWRWTALALSVLVAFVLGRVARAALLSVAGRMDRRVRPLMAVAARAIAFSSGMFALAIGLDVHVEEFGPSSLNARAYYWYHSKDYWPFYAHAEKVNMEILRRFNEEGIEFAFPTQTLFLTGDRKRPLQPPAGA